MIEPFKEAQIISCVFQSTAPADVQWSPATKGLSFKWNCYLGRGFSTGQARADFSDLHGLHYFSIQRKNEIFSDFLWRSGTAKNPDSPEFVLKPRCLHLPTTMLALRYLVTKRVDITAFEEQHSFPISYHQRMAWADEFNQIMKRFPSSEAPKK